MNYHNLIRRSLKKIPTLLFASRYWASKFKYINWNQVSRDGGEAVESNRINGKRILFATSVGAQIGGVNLESTIASALQIRGHKCHFAICDAALPACMACEIGLYYVYQLKSNSISKKLCKICSTSATRCLSSLGLPVYYYSEFIKKTEKESITRKVHRLTFSELLSLSEDHISVGEHAYAGVLRFYARSDLEGQPCSQRLFKQYVCAALFTKKIFERILDEGRYDTAVFSHGIYVPYGIIGEVCRQRNVRVVNWNPGYRKNTFIFSHHDTYHRTMINEPTEHWENMSFDADRESRLMDYLDSRKNGKNDWIWFHDNPQYEIDDELFRRGISFDQPTIGLLTSVVWDAVLHYESNAFHSMMEWILFSIDYFRSRPELQLLIRVHPAEIQGGLPSRQRVSGELKKHYPTLPENVYLIDAESPLSTYALMKKCQCVIIYNTKTGIELAAQGMNVIVAGEAWIRNKGFSTDVVSSSNYKDVLDQLPFTYRLDKHKQLLAKKYAYHYFFRRLIPLGFTSPARGNPPFQINISSLSSLMPGNSSGLDVICHGIIHQDDFIWCDYEDYH